MILVLTSIAKHKIYNISINLSIYFYIFYTTLFFLWIFEIKMWFIIKISTIYKLIRDFYFILITKALLNASKKKKKLKKEEKMKNSRY